jgi:exopolysaccharide production protein ExoY
MAVQDHDLAVRQARSGPSSTRAGSPRSGGLYNRAVKRAIDIFLVVLSAPFVVPLVGILALLVRRDGGPAFYSQHRVGRGGEDYVMWKLRSMVPDADARLARHLAANPAARDEWTTTQKLRDDPRITRFGRYLRKSSLDELPQLWNVLTGTMSLVGPRPMMTCQRPLYPGRAYFRLRPGLTGPWQVSVRNDSRFDDRVAFDDRYERDLSFLTDARLIMQTFRVVLSANGH